MLTYPNYTNLLTKKGSSKLMQQPKVCWCVLVCCTLFLSHVNLSQLYKFNCKGLPIPVDPPPAPAPVVSAQQPVAHVAPVAAPVLAAPESLPAPEAAAAVELPPPEPVVEQHTV